MSPTERSDYTFNRSDVRPNATLLTPENIECRVDRIEGDNVFLTVMQGRKIEGQDHITMSFDELQNAHWKLKKAAA